jgi:hypothetical protein
LCGEDPANLGQPNLHFDQNPNIMQISSDGGKSAKVANELMMDECEFPGEPHGCIHDTSSAKTRNLNDACRVSVVLSDPQE